MRYEFTKIHDRLYRLGPKGDESMTLGELIQRYNLLLEAEHIEGHGFVATLSRDGCAYATTRGSALSLCLDELARECREDAIKRAKGQEVPTYVTPYGVIYGDGDGKFVVGSSIYDTFQDAVSALAIAEGWDGKAAPIATEPEAKTGGEEE